MPARSRFLAWGLVAGLGIGSILAPEIAAGQPEQDQAAAKVETAAPSREAIRRAVTRAVPLLVKASADEYPKHRACFSCHNQAVPAVALKVARQRGFAVFAQTIRLIAEHTEAGLNDAPDAYLKGEGQPGGVVLAGFALWALEAAGWPRDETTAGVAHYLAVSQRDVGSWHVKSRSRPFQAYSDSGFPHGRDQFISAAGSAWAVAALALACPEKKS